MGAKKEKATTAPMVTPTSAIVLRLMPQRGALGDVLSYLQERPISLGSLS